LKRSPTTAEHHANDRENDYKRKEEDDGSEKTASTDLWIAG
jgi:hypothetical protein